MVVDVEVVKRGNWPLNGQNRLNCRVPLLACPAVILSITPFALAGKPPVAPFCKAILCASGALQVSGFVCGFPGEIRIIASKVSAGSSFAEDGASQVQVFDDAFGGERK